MKAGRIGLYSLLVFSVLFAGITAFLYFFERSPRAEAGSGSAVFASQSAQVTPVVADKSRAVSGRGGQAIVFYSGDMNGNLEACQCTEPPMGGVARRATSMRAYKNDSRGIPSLVLETGNAMKQSDKLDDPMNFWIVTALDEVGVHAVNTTFADFLRLNTLASKGKLPKAIRSQYLATTVESAANAPFVTKPYFVESLEVEPGKPAAKIGILGISQPPDAAVPSAIKTIPIEEALKKYVPEVEAQSDFIILMARAQDADLSRLARMFPGIDVIVNGSSTSEGRELPKVGSTIILESARNGTSLGILNLEWDAKGHIVKYSNQFVPLPPMVADSPQLALLMEKVRKDMAVYYEAEARSSPPVSGHTPYLGAPGCKICHEKAYKVWEKSGHARAIDTLKKAAQHFNPDCLPCHVTGLGVSGGFVNAVRTSQLANVQCEECHGPAADHAKKPMEVHPGVGMGQQFRKRMTEASCVRCHSAGQSPRFKYAEYLQKIAH